MGVGVVGLEDEGEDEGENGDRDVEIEVEDEVAWWRMALARQGKSPAKALARPMALPTPW